MVKFFLWSRESIVERVKRLMDTIINRRFYYRFLTDVNCYEKVLKDIDDTMQQCDYEDMKAIYKFFITTITEKPKLYFENLLKCIMYNAGKHQVDLYVLGAGVNSFYVFTDPQIAVLAICYTLQGLSDSMSYKKYQLYKQLSSYCSCFLSYCDQKFKYANIYECPSAKTSFEGVERVDENNIGKIQDIIQITLDKVFEYIGNNKDFIYQHQLDEKDTYIYKIMDTLTFLLRYVYDHKYKGNQHTPDVVKLFMDTCETRRAMIFMLTCDMYFEATEDTK